MKQQYLSMNLRPTSLQTIATMNAIIGEYLKAGYKLTMRQLYYQLVARGKIANTVQSYKQITGLGNDARLCGLMDWDAIEDRTRELFEQNHWTSPASIIRACADQYHEDMWVNQDHRLLVIVEKEALAGIIERTCRRFDVPYLAARGYPSVTVLREITQRYFTKAQGKQEVVVLHLGDHDPSGIDMSRDLEERFNIFLRDDAPDLRMDFRRIALNMRQIEEVQPPPNPAKTTDSRFQSYLAEYGDESWELDALDPAYLDDLIAGNIERYIDKARWTVAEERIERGKMKLQDAAERIEEEDGGDDDDTLGDSGGSEE